MTSTRTEPDPERIPVIVGSGQSIERTGMVTPLELMERAAELAFAEASGLRGMVDRVSVVSILSTTGPAPASELAASIGALSATGEVTTPGGNSPQWLVNRAASDIAAGRLGVTVIAGAETVRSQRARRAAGLPRVEGPPGLAPDPVIGDDHPGVGPAESAIGLLAPVHVYPMFESVVAARAGHDAATHRRAMSELLAPFSEVAARHPFAWFPRAYRPEEIAEPSPDNRIVAEPYTKRMASFGGTDQGAVLVVCSLAAARRAGVADRAVFIWAGAEATDVRFPASRPDPGRSPAIAAAGRALFDAASAAAGAGKSIGIDDPALLDIYSCFPSAVELATEALGVDQRDRRGLTVTGGLPYFGGPWNNYVSHSIATLTERLRDHGADGPPLLGMTTGLGWFVTKHALGIYGSAPPPGGFRRGDTSADQAAIDASEIETVLTVDTPTPATVVATTVVRDHDGSATAAPVIARLPDGRHMALAAEDDEIESVGRLDVPGRVGTQLVVQPGPPRYRLAIS